MQILRRLARIWTALLALAALMLALGLTVRWLVPVSPWIAAPALESSSPVDGTPGVLPRSEISLRFSTPMNRASTQAALSLTPPTAGSFRWSDDVRELTFTPADTLAPNTDYTLRVGDEAQSRWWRTISQQPTIRFRTAPLPAVVAALPASSGVPLDGSLAIIFSQAMVPADRLNEPVALPQLQIEPPVSAQMRWIDQTTLLVSPDTPLRAATHYSATVAANLTDLRGVDLGRPFSWSWTTAWPEVLSRSPAEDASWVSPHQPVVLTLSAPLDVAILRSSLRFDPPVENEIATAQIGASQVVTVTPRLTWGYGQSYQVRLASDDPGLVAPPDLGWRFSIEPEPGLIAFFPGQGQALAAGQDVRLIFSTPMEEVALRAGLRIDPPVGDLALQVSEAEVRLRANLRPSMAYTITVAADTRDRSGEPLGVTETVRLRAAPADPALGAPSAIDHVISLPISQTARITLERINLSQLDLSLYQLDAPTVVRALSLSPDEWRDFDPERYGQTVAHSWQLPLSDPSDTLVRTPVTVALADDALLPAGIYYLRVRSREGPQADLLLQVSAVNLTLRQSDSQVLIWATDRASETPAANVPLLLYAGEALIARGQTGADGVWEQPIQRPAGDAPYLAIADGAAPALVRGDWLAAPTGAVAPRYHSLLFLDRLTYRPGDSVYVGGVARVRSADNSLALPDAGATCRIRIESTAPPVQRSSANCTLATTGAVSGTLRLPTNQPPGSYQLLVDVGDSTTDLALHVSTQDANGDLRFAEADSQVNVRATRAGTPWAGATISWTLRMEPLAAPAVPDGFSFGTKPGAGEESSGVSIADIEGRIAVPLPVVGAEAGALRYRLWAEVRSGGTLIAANSYEGRIAPDAARVGVRLASRIVSSSERATVEAMALAADDSPAPGERISIAVYRSGDVGGAPVIARAAVSDRQGRVTVQLVQLRPGAYEVVAALGDQSSRAGLWVAGGRYAGWQNAPGQVTVVADRESYRAGDVARLLVTTPYARASLLLTAERGNLHSAEVRNLTASQLITLTITPEMAPAVSIGAVVASGSERLVGNTAIHVAAEGPPLAVAIVTDSNHYAPASTAVLSITTSIASGEVAPEVLVAVAPADAPDDMVALTRFTTAPPPPLTTAMLQPAPARASTVEALMSAALPGGEGYMVSPNQGAGGDGQQVLYVPLPNSSGRWRISAYAIAGGGRFASASTAVTTSLPLDLTVAGPPALWPGDRAETSLLIRNTSAVTQSLQVRVRTVGGEVDQATSTERQLLLVPGGTQRLIWAVSPREGVRVMNLRYTVDGADLHEQMARDLAIEVTEPAAATAGAAAPQAGVDALSAPISLHQEYIDPLSGTPINPGELWSGQVVALHITLVSARPIPRGSLEIALPAALQLIELKAHTPFMPADAPDEMTRRLRIEATEIRPGVYTVRALLRVVAVGEFSAPGARLLLDDTLLPAVVAPAGPTLIVLEHREQL